MTQKIGIIYSSVDGQTKKICKKLNEVFEEKQIRTELYAIEAFNANVLEYHTLILGASIRYGKHNNLVYNFITKNKEQLKSIKTVFFSVNLVARKNDKNSASTNPYLIKFIKETNWQPNVLEVFAGKLDYKSYGFLDKLMIKLIMRLTHGPTKTEAPIEFTDWEKVYNFGLKISEGLKKTNP